MRSDVSFFETFFEHFAKLHLSTVTFAFLNILLLLLLLLLLFLLFLLLLVESLEQHVFAFFAFPCRVKCHVLTLDFLFSYLLTVKLGDTGSLKALKISCNIVIMYAGLNQGSFHCKKDQLSKSL